MKWEPILAECIDRMVYVEGGTFIMGDDESEHKWEKPAHKEHVASFYLGQFPVTQQLWEKVMGNNPSCFKHIHRPVERVTWEAVKRFLSSLNEMTHLDYRLPFEGEWEYAARGGSQPNTHLFSGSHLVDEVAWHEDNSGGESKAVGLKLPNELGLHDMSGNVWEWCEDGYGYYAAKLKNKGKDVHYKGPPQAAYRVIRGGSWLFDAQKTRVTNRYFYDPEDAYEDIGFRLCRSI